MGSRVTARGRDKASKFSLSPNNVRTRIDKKKLNDLMLSIKEFNEVLEPIIINKSNEVIAGGRRWRAAKELDMEIDWIQKEYDEAKDEIFDSGAENMLHYEMDSDDKVKMTIKLKDEFNCELEEIANKMGVEIQTIRKWYNKGKGPKAIIPEDEKRKLEDAKKKKKEKTKQESLSESEKRIQETDETKKLKKQAKEKWDSLTLKRSSVVRRIIDSPHFTKNIGEILDFIEFSKETTLRMLEDIYKDVNKGIPVNLEFRKQISNHISECILRTVRVPKVMMGKITPIMKRRKMDFSEVAIESLMLWLRKWSLEEDWEGELSKELPEIFK